MISFFSTYLRHRNNGLRALWKTLSFSLFLLAHAQLVHAQLDTAFWFVAPDVSSGQFLDRPVFLRFTTLNQAATVTVEQPANIAFPVQTINIPANGTQSIDLTPWIDQVECFPPDAVLNKGIKITATSPVTAYYEVVSGNYGANAWNPEAFVLKGKNAVGTDFWIPSQNVVNNAPNYTPTPYSSFDIVATADNTSVTIIPSNAIVGHAAGTPFTIMLNRGQSYSATAASQLASQHLGGSQVTASKPVAITVTDDLIGGTPYPGCADLAGDQIVPTNVLGKDYIAIKGLLGNIGDYVFITGTQNNTQIAINNAGPVATINAGQTYAAPLTTASTYIQTSNPAYVWQLSGSGCELGAAILPTILCTGSHLVSYVRSSNFQLYVNLLVENGGQNSFTINGNPVNGSLFSPVTGTANAWWYASILLPLAQYPQGSVIRVVNDNYKFHLSTIDINGGGTSYGYFSNYGLALAEVTVAPNPLCEGDTIHFTGAVEAGSDFEWTGPNGFSSQLQSPVIADAEVIHSGVYVLHVSKDNCTASDSVLVTVHPTPEIRILNNDTAVCAGASILLQTQSKDADTYQWIPSTYLDGPSDDHATSVPEHSVAYKVTASNEWGCNSSDSVSITVYPNPEVTITAADTVADCTDPLVQLQVSGADQYTWTPAMLCDDNKSSHPVVNPKETTTFVVTGRNQYHCSASDSVMITYAANGVLFIPNAFSPNGDGLNEQFYPVVYCDIALSQFRVYNRYGELVFRTQKPDTGWNGIFKDKPADLGVYFWYFEGKDEHGKDFSRKGDVLLVR